jgi:hypothetical protein
MKIAFSVASLKKKLSLEDLIYVKIFHSTRRFKNSARMGAVMRLKGGLVNGNFCDYILNQDSGKTNNH